MENKTIFWTVHVWEEEAGIEQSIFVAPIFSVGEVAKLASDGVLSFTIRTTDPIPGNITILGISSQK